MFRTRRLRAARVLSRFRAARVLRATCSLVTRAARDAVGREAPERDARRAARGVEGVPARASSGARRSSRFRGLADFAASEDVIGREGARQVDEAPTART